ncbi:MAG: class IV adenylate cyclase [Candidatus Nomurabacteria bacterium]|jgi:adenylate cyclase class 2|nr:class IV adenylate cyclase [Candidatus Nomurabacteria bacterium]
MAKIEIESKYELKNTQKVVKFLDKNAKLKYESRQIDTYFDSPAVGYTTDLENGRRIDYWLRLREEDSQSSVNFKDWSISDNIGYCDEFESAVESATDVKTIFGRMGFKPVAVVDKTRRAYAYKDFEVSIDIVKELGDYIEIEYYGNSDDIKKVQSQIGQILTEIGAKTAPEDHRGYPYHLIARSRGKISS